MAEEIVTQESPQESSPAAGQDAFEAAANEVLDAAAPQEDNAPASSDRNPQSSPQENTDSVEWDKLPPAAKRAYEETRKQYDSLRSLQSRQANEWKTKEEQYKSYEPSAKQLKYLNDLYESNPKVKAVLDEALGVKPQVDPDLAQDPVMQYWQNWESKLQNSLRPVFDFVAKQQTAQQEQELNSRVDKVTESARTEYKTLFGKDPTDQDLAKIYQHMTEKRVYDGETAVRSVYMQEAIKAKVQEALESQMAKKSTSSRLSSVNPSKAKPNGKIESWDDAFESAVEELGLTF